MVIFIYIVKSLFVFYLTVYALQFYSGGCFLNIIYKKCTVGYGIKTLFNIEHEATKI